MESMVSVMLEVVLICTKIKEYKNGNKKNNKKVEKL